MVETIDNDCLLRCLAEWVRETEVLTGDAYTLWATKRGLPGKQTIAIRFGSWNEALVLAGIGVQEDRGGLRPRFSDAAV